MPDGDERLLTPDIADAIGRETPPRQVTVTDEVVRRVLETVGETLPPSGDTAPPYVLMAFGADPPLPETPAAPLSLVTGDEWTLHRPLHVGERLTVSGRWESAHERYGGRFGHALQLHYGWTFRDADGRVVAEVGRGMMRYRVDEGRESRDPGAAADGGQAAGQAGPRPPRAGDGPAPAAPLEPARLPLAEGDALGPAVLRPTILQVARYCGLTWNFVPLFLDPDAAHRAGMPGPIVPGPLKLALITRCLAVWARPAGRVHALRCTYRRPDLVGRPFTVRGSVTRVADEGGERRVQCEVWTENAAGERSVGAVATLAFPAQ
jgi:acyl dehydratase